MPDVQPAAPRAAAGVRVRTFGAGSYARRTAPNLVHALGRTVTLPVPQVRRELTEPTSVGLKVSPWFTTEQFWRVWNRTEALVSAMVAGEPSTEPAGRLPGAEEGASVEHRTG